MNLPFFYRFYRSLAKLGRQEKLSRDELVMMQAPCRNYVTTHTPTPTFTVSFTKGWRAALSELPVLSKKAVMENFDDLVTNRNIKLADTRKHISDNTPGKLYLNEYEIAVCNSRSNTGQTGRCSVFAAPVKKRE